MARPAAVGRYHRSILAVVCIALLVAPLLVPVGADTPLRTPSPAGESDTGSASARIAIVSATLPELAADATVQWGVRSKQCYAAQHGFGFFLHVATPPPVSALQADTNATVPDGGWDPSPAHTLVWGSVQALLAFHEQYDWLLLVDAAAVVTNPSVGLQEVVARAATTLAHAQASGGERGATASQPATPTVILQDSRVLDGGAVMVAGTPDGRAFLEQWAGEATAAVAEGRPAHVALLRVLVRRALTTPRRPIPGLGITPCPYPPLRSLQAPRAGRGGAVRVTAGGDLTSRLADSVCWRSMMEQAGWPLGARSGSGGVVYLPRGIIDGPEPATTATSRPTRGGMRLASRNPQLSHAAASNLPADSTWRPGDLFLLDPSPEWASGVGGLAGVATTCTCPADGNATRLGPGTPLGCAASDLPCDPRSEREGARPPVCLAQVWSRDSVTGAWSHTYGSVWDGYRDTAPWRDHAAASGTDVVSLTVTDPDSGSDTDLRLYDGDHVSSRVVDFLHAHGLTCTPGHVLHVTRALFELYGLKTTPQDLFSQLDVSTPRVQAVQVGTSNGRAGIIDPFLSECHWDALVVDPVPVAVAETSGTARLGVLPPHQAWPHGAASLLPVEELLQGAELDSDQAEVASDGLWSEWVETVSWAELLQRHNIARVDVLGLGTDGFDWRVLKQLNLTDPASRPHLIHATMHLVPADEQRQAVEFLSQANYVTWMVGNQVVAAADGGRLLFDDVARELLPHVRSSAIRDLGGDGGA